MSGRIDAFFVLVHFFCLFYTLIKKSNGRLFFQNKTLEFVFFAEYLTRKCIKSNQLLSKMTIFFILLCQKSKGKNIKKNYIKILFFCISFVCNIAPRGETETGIVDTTINSANQPDRQSFFYTIIHIIRYVSIFFYIYITSTVN